MTSVFCFNADSKSSIITDGLPIDTANHTGSHFSGISQVVGKSSTSKFQMATSHLDLMYYLDLFVYHAMF